MRRTRLTALTLFALFIGAGDALAKWPKVRIPQDSIRIGLPPGRSAGERDEGGAAAFVSKMNAWAPVYFDLEILDVFDDATKADAILHVRARTPTATRRTTPCPSAISSAGIRVN